MGDAIYQDWASNPDVEILHVLDELNQPYSCIQWGNKGSEGIPPIILGESSIFFNLFNHPGDGSSRPLVVFINHEMEIIYLDDHHISQTDAHALITLMLDALPPLSIETNINPKEFFIHQLYPNPFNPVLNIDFEISQAGWVKVNITDITGSMVKTVYEGFEGVGKHQISWDSETLPSGTYFVTLELNESLKTSKVVLLK